MPTDKCDGHAGIIPGMPAPPPAQDQLYERARVGWLSVAQLITWGSVFYTFALLIEPIDESRRQVRLQACTAVGATTRTVVAGVQPGTAG